MTRTLNDTLNLPHFRRLLSGPVIASVQGVKIRHISYVYVTNSELDVFVCRLISSARSR